MATTINADTVTGGAIVTGDASGVLELQAAGVTKLTVNSSGVTLAAPLPVASGGTGGSATPTAGGVVYGTGSVQAVTSAGTSGQVLQSNGASAPTWVTPSAGAVSLITSVNIANVQTHNFTGLSGYYNYRLCVTAVSSSPFTGTAIRIQVGSGSASSSSYYFGGVYSNGSSVSSTERDSDSAFVPFDGVGDLSNSYSIQLSTDIFTAPSQNITFQSRGNGYGNGNNTQTANLMGVWLAGTSMSSIHLNLGSTNFTGSIYLYGVKNA